MESELVYKRKDGRWEARYKKGISEKGKTLYGTVYGKSKSEVINKRIELLGFDPYGEKNSSDLNLLILGAGSHGKDVMEIATSLRIFKKISFLDDKLSGDLIIGKCKNVMQYRREYPCAFIAIGDSEVRKKYANLLMMGEFYIPTIISPAANVSNRAIIGRGVVVCPQATVGDVTVGDYCILSSNSVVNSGSQVSGYSYVGCGGIIPKNCKVPEGTWIEDGTVFTEKQ